MSSQLEKSVLTTVRSLRMIAPGDCVGVAVSGGADSVALFRLLESLREQLGITLATVHLNHSLRGAESDADESFAVELARAHGVECIVAREDVAARAARNAWNLEDAARRVRYEFFDRIVAERRATRIAVAHTADDQAETVLAHLIRGTGTTGLAGIHPVAGSVVRPLLFVRRHELRVYLRSLAQPWREDSSNRDTRRTRARIREHLLPVLETEFSPAIVKRLGRLARLAREEGLFWDEFVERCVSSSVRASDGSYAIAASDLLSPLHWNPNERAPGRTIPMANEGSPPRALTERLIRRLYEAVRGNRRELTAEHVEQVIHLASASSGGGRVELPGEIDVERSFGDLIFTHSKCRWHPPDSQNLIPWFAAYQYQLTLPDAGAAIVSVPELGSCFSLKVIDWPAQERDTKRDGVALDADLLRSPLILRNWRPGDAYRPRGRRQVRKLKQMFLEGRVPLRQRAGWPVLESGGRVIWARGMDPAEDVCATDRTRIGVFVKEVRI
ncbi:MAG: tRNA lysidine(34) synthetase TilS [Candidatus Acidiferrales bacterium]